MPNFVPLSRGTREESCDELGGYTKRHKVRWLRVIPLHRDYVALQSPLKGGRGA